MKVKKRFSLLFLALFVAVGMKGEENILPYWALGGFERPADINPLISPKENTLWDCPMLDAKVKWECADTFNPAAVVKDGKIVVLYRAEDDPNVGIGKRTSRIGYFETTDGIHEDFRADKPVMFPDKSSVSKTYEWPGGTEDPRVVEANVDGKTLYVMTYTSWNRDTPRLSIATSEDLKSWIHQGPAFKKALSGKYADLACKSGSIVTEIKDGRLQAAKIDINGQKKYFMYWGESWVCGAVSDNLTDWTPIVNDDLSLRYLVRPRNGYFDSMLTECGPPAVKTENGIVLLYNGKNKSGSNGDALYPSNTYAAGQMLFSNEDPLTLLDRLDKPFFRPMADFEKSGQYAAGTVFVEGLVYHHNKWYIYYGCADSFVGVAVYDPETSPRIGDPIYLNKIPDGVINQQEGAHSGKMRCFVNSCSGMVNNDESAFFMNTSYIYPNRKWCDTSTDMPWIVLEFTDIYSINRLHFRDVGKREDNCGNVPEYWVYVRTSNSEEWKLVAHEENVSDQDEKDITFPEVDARYVKIQFKRGIRPSGVPDNAIRLYGCDIYGTWKASIERTDGNVSTGKTVMYSYDSRDATKCAMNLLAGVSDEAIAWGPSKGTPLTDPQRFVVIDLEKECQIKRIQIIDAMSVNASAKNIDSYQIFTSLEAPDLGLMKSDVDNNTCWTKVAERRNAGGVSRKTIPFSTPVNARYVKFVIPRTNGGVNNVDNPSIHAFNVIGEVVDDGNAIGDVKMAPTTLRKYSLNGYEIPQDYAAPYGIYISNGKKYLK